MPPDLPRENLWTNIEMSELLSTLNKTGAGNAPADSPRLSSSHSLSSEGPFVALRPLTSPHSAGPQRAAVGGVSEGSRATRGAVPAFHEAPRRDKRPKGRRSLTAPSQRSPTAAAPPDLTSGPPPGAGR